jgi:gluconolactonase
VDIDKGTASNSKVFAEGFAPGFTDGMKCDVEGNVWCSMGWADRKEDGVRCYTPAGQLIGKIHLPETCANLVFGGPLHDRLYMCASTSVYSKVWLLNDPFGLETGRTAGPSQLSMVS